MAGSHGVASGPQAACVAHDAVLGAQNLPLGAQSLPLGAQWLALREQSVPFGAQSETSFKGRGSCQTFRHPVPKSASRSSVRRADLPKGME